MLSKLRHVGAAENAFTYEKENPASALQAMLVEDLVVLQPLAGGTLGVCFIGELAGQRRFFKTHSVPAGRQTLEREAVFLGATAGDRVDARLISTEAGGRERTWLHMKVLRPCDALAPSVVRKLSSDYETVLHSSSLLAALVPKTDGIGLLLSEAEAGLALLADQRLLSLAVQRQVHGCLDRLHLNCAAWPVQLCHGDLGPANILADERGPVIIDWEDAFWGVSGYDYLYWLTFFTNRKWLSREVLGHTPWGHTNEVALMVVILLLKSLISVRNDSFRQNRISFDQRLLEVMNLD